MSANEELPFNSADMLVDIAPDFTGMEPIGYAPIDREPLTEGLNPVNHTLIEQLMASEQLGEVGVTAQRYIRNVRIQRDFGAFMIGSVERAIATSKAQAAEAANAVAEANTATIEATAQLIEVTTAIKHATVTMTAATVQLTEATEKLLEATAKLTAATAASSRAIVELTDGEATLVWMRRGMSTQNGEPKTMSHEFSVFDELHG